MDISRSHSETHTLEVLAYAARNKANDVLDSAASFSVGLSIADACAAMPLPYFAVWVRVDFSSYSYNGRS